MKLSKVHDDAPIAFAAGGSDQMTPQDLLACSVKATDLDFV